jgi:hypothetical protein
MRPKRSLDAARGMSAGQFFAAPLPAPIRKRGASEARDGDRNRSALCRKAERRTVAPGDCARRIRGGP